jgi:branched-chain amino acid aminotransferase
VVLHRFILHNDRIHEASEPVLAPGQVGLLSGWGVFSTRDIIALTADSKEWGNEVKLGIVPHARHAACEFSTTKILSWAMNLTWVETAQQRGLDEVILLNELGDVAECTSANIFASTGGQVWTPPISSGCLPGVTREVLLGELHVPGIHIAEKTLTQADLENADEVFITSTTRNLLPVRQIEGKTIGRTDRTRQALAEAFGHYVDRYVATHKAATV